ncbi:MAG TPA: hypothetical protein VD887_05460 [Allosphingosinicella sp.]|nr:hypothetical protein [Allosphingosinicella sp.]
MVRVLAIAAAGALACLSAVASAQGSDAAETVTVSRHPTGLHSSSAPDFDVTVWPDGLVVIRTRTYRAAFPVERVLRFRRSAAEAAEVRAALLPYRRADLTRTTLCRGRHDGDILMLRGFDVFGITWSGPGHFSTFDACYEEQERAVVAAIERALRSVHLTLSGTEQ